MGSREHNEQPDVPPFEYRAGVTMPVFGGMYRRGDESQIPPHRLHLGVNIRMANGELGDRPGLSRVEGTADDACITGIFEIDDFAVGVYIDVIADGGLNAAGNKLVSSFAVMAFNEDRDPVTRNYWDQGDPPTFVKKVPGPWRDASSAPVPTQAFNTFQRMNDRLVVANGTQLFQAEMSEDDQQPRMDLSIFFDLATTTASGNIVSTCVRRERVDDPLTGAQFDKDVLYMGLDSGEIWRYDGTTIELVHTLASGGWMQLMCWKGNGLVAAGDPAGGFAWQEQPGYSWNDVAWHDPAFSCNGLCEFLGEVVFVGERTDGTGGWIAEAAHWDGTGAPTVFATDGTFNPLGDDFRYRTPVVAAGALHWLSFGGESIDPPPLQANAYIARYEDFATGDTKWASIGQLGLDGDYGFFIEFAGALLFLARSTIPGPSWAAGETIVLCYSGASPQMGPLYNWPLDAVSAYRLTGTGYEAMSN